MHSVHSLAQGGVRGGMQSTDGKALAPPHPHPENMFPL